MPGIVLVGASTGAPRTHHVYLSRASEGFPAPIVIIQHMPCGPFIEGMMRYLAGSVRAPTKIACDGDPLLPGHVLVVQPGTQLEIGRTGRRVRIVPNDGTSAFSPSMDIAFSNAGKVCRRLCIAVLISGLHAEHDGLAGCRAVRRAGGRVTVRGPDRCPHPWFP